MKYSIFTKYSIRFNFTGFKTIIWVTLTISFERYFALKLNLFSHFLSWLRSFILPSIHESFPSAIGAEANDDILLG